MKTSYNHLDVQDFTLSQESYSSMIDYLNTLSPFKAIRQAEDINKMNDFEVISRVEIAEWKKSIRNEKMKSQIMKSQKSKIEIVKMKS